MAIKGNIEDVSIVDFLQLMRYGTRNGVLKVIEDNGTVHNIYLSEGLIIFASTSENINPLGEIIVNQGLIKEEDKDRYLNEFTSSGDREERFGEFLIKKGILQRHIVEELIRKQLETILMNIISLSSGRFTFEPGKSISNNEDIRTSIDINDILLNQAERSKEWKEIKKYIRDDNEIFEFPSENYMILNKKGIKLSWIEWNVLNLLNGKNSIRDISERIGESIFEVSSILLRLLKENLIKRKDVVGVSPRTSKTIEKEPGGEEKTDIKVEKDKSIINRILSRIKSI
jgi:DNA-binding MarR family transcriptional regulator